MAESILLVRHGEPLREHRSKIRGRDFGRYSDAYQVAGLAAHSVPPAELQALVDATRILMSSALPRAIQSAERLASESNRSFKTDPLFNEARVPTALPFSLSLSPHHWGIVARTAWFLGWSGGVESYGEAKRRAETGAARLAEIAAHEGSVALIAHGMINFLIGRALRRAGWHGRGRTRNYWEYVLFTR